MDQQSPFTGRAAARGAAGQLLDAVVPAREAAWNDMDHVILSPSGESLPVDLDQLVAAAQERWPEAVSQARASDDGSLLTLEVQPDGEPLFQVFALGPVLQVATDGIWEQALEVAELTTSLIPPEALAGEWWFAVEDLSAHTALEAGMTKEEIAQGWTRDPGRGPAVA